jgi:ribosomal protein L11 methyltransferase
MYLWRRPASQRWWSDNEEKLRTAVGDRLAIIEQAGRKRLQLEVTSRSRSDAQKLAKEFGGRVEKLSKDWLKRFSCAQKIKPLRIGERLLITNVGGTSVSRVRAGLAGSRRQGRSHIVIPAGAAFGTGEHATTAMSLRMLEQVMRFWGAHAPSRAIFGAPAENPRKRARSRGRDRQHARRVRSPKLVVDLGTGSGILALAARLLGAQRVIGIDNDPTAIATAKENARLNKIRTVKFRLGDVRRWKPSRGIDIVIANLFSELLIEILPKLRAARWMILSGILRNQERDVTRALRRHKIDIVQVRRRGKWVAILTAVR